MFLYARSCSVYWSFMAKAFETWFFPARALTLTLQSIYICIFDTFVLVFICFGGLNVCCTFGWPLQSERMNRDNRKKYVVRAHSQKPAIKTSICSLFKYSFYFPFELNDKETTKNIQNKQTVHSIHILRTQKHSHIACNWPHLIRIFEN